MTMTAKRRLWMAGGLGLAALVSSCSDAKSSATKIQPAKVEAVAGSDQKKVTLTEDAARRIDLKTAAIKDGTSAQRKVVPYAAVVYDAKGATWVYVNSQPLAFLRQSITIESIVGGDAIVTEGPAAGTNVVVVGVAELFGAESGVGK
jgi:hypothetical protein